MIRAEAVQCQYIHHADIAGSVLGNSAQSLLQPQAALTAGAGVGLTPSAGFATASTLLPQSCTAQITARLDTPQPPADRREGGWLVGGWVGEGRSQMQEGAV
jgi:hypothetical protein